MFRSHLSRNLVWLEITIFHSILSFFVGALVDVILFEEYKESFSEHLKRKHVFWVVFHKRENRKDHHYEYHHFHRELQTMVQNI